MRDLACKADQGRWKDGGGLGGRKGTHKRLLRYPSLPICWLSVQIRLSPLCVAVRRGLTSLCTPPVSQHILIGSDLGMTHHMPTPHASPDLYLPLSSSPPVLLFMHLCSSPTNTPTPHPLSRCSFVPFHSHFPLVYTFLSLFCLLPF